MSSFLIPKKDWVARYDWDSFAHEKRFYISFHLVKFLLIYGEIDTVLRLRAHPEVCFSAWKTEYIFVRPCRSHIIWYLMFLTNTGS
jgi:hypothetical protein